MKVLIIFAICIVAVFAIEDTSNNKRIEEMLKEAGKVCLKELNIDPSNFMEDATMEVEACYHACLDKKMGVLNDDGTYILERILSFAETPEIRKQAEHHYNTKIKDCASSVPVGTHKRDCKMAACLHKMPKSYYMGDE